MSNRTIDPCIYPWHHPPGCRCGATLLAGMPKPAEQPASNPSGVRRYDLTTKPYHYGASMDRHEDGEWVLYEDYEPLHAEIERLTAKLASLRRGYQNFVNDSGAERDRLRAALDEAVAILREHRYCGGDTYPSNGHPAVIAFLSKVRRAPDETSAAQETVEVRRGAWVFVRTQWNTGHAIVQVRGTDFLVTKGTEGGLGTSENGSEQRD